MPPSSLWLAVTCSAVDVQGRRECAGVIRLDKPDLPVSKACHCFFGIPALPLAAGTCSPRGSFTDWPGQPAGAGSVIDPAPFQERVLLSDGGVYDNRGLEPIVISMFLSMLMAV
jgi:hypothetical protein